MNIFACSSVASLVLDCNFNADMLPWMFACQIAE
uniref:Uncharacterized protein n=1 Tax=Rhizophora mucronata TaxID=61149 RepID=A0A2P2JEE2_RHIMU